MNNLKTLVTFVAAAILSMMMAACTPTTPESVVYGVTYQPATAEELALRDTKVIQKVAKDVAHKYLLRDPTACDLTEPVELHGLPAFDKRPLTGFDAYKAACKAEIKLMAQERRDAANRAVAKAKAAAMAKAKQVAKLKACDRVAGRQQKQSCQATAKRKVAGV